MPQEITISVPLLIVLSIVGVILVALITALITRAQVQRRIRREQIDEIAMRLDSLYKKGALQALRFQPGTERILARGTNSNLEVPVRSDVREFGAGSFVGIDNDDLRDAIGRLQRQKAYQTVDWHEEGGNYHELKLRPEFLDSRHALA